MNLLFRLVCKSFNINVLEILQANQELLLTPLVFSTGEDSQTDALPTQEAPWIRGRLNLLREAAFRELRQVQQNTGVFSAKRESI